MLGWVIALSIIASLVALFSVGGIAGFAIQAGKLVVTVAVILFVISAVVGLVRRGRPTMS